MNYPLLQEYIDSIKAAEDNFEQLSSLRPVVDNSGDPIVYSGGFAVVFKMKDEKNGSPIQCIYFKKNRKAEQKLIT